MSKRDAKKPDPAEPDTTGHVWDGIEEYNNPLPRWWLWSLYATILWAVLYTIAYPAWPMISGATPGLLGWSTRANVAADIAAVEQANAGLTAQLASADLATLGNDPALDAFAVSAGAAIFRAHCSQCHGSGAAGAKGYPNLLDDDWLWGGSITDIAYTVNHGIRNEQDVDARYSQMPAFGDILTSTEIEQVVNHVRAISGQEHDATLAAAGATLFLDNCSSCHGEDGKGIRDFGAPNLTDAIWLYGGDEETLTTTVKNARFGVMPAWGLRLDPAEVNAVAVYVHQLGGGE
jgi:cytochrome c oxidase cbb3-type subunit 3